MNSRRDAPSLAVLSSRSRPMTRAAAAYESQCWEEYVSAEVLANAINERAQALVSEGGRFCPLDADNFAEAVGNADTQALAQVIGLLRDDKTASEGASRLLFMAHAYWDVRAGQQARADMEHAERTALEVDGD
jgi:hypothetical protein